MRSLEQRGFTIIELLVVIAIIGILAATILGSLNDARSQGIDTKIISEMDAIAKRAAINESSTLTYDVVCGTNGFTQAPEIANLVASINTLASSTLTCNSDTEAYAVSVPLAEAHWCIDSTGVRRSVPDALVVSPLELACP